MIRYASLPPAVRLGDEIRLAAVGAIEPDEGRAEQARRRPASGGAALFCSFQGAGEARCGEHAHPLPEGAVLALRADGALSARAERGVFARLCGGLAERQLEEVWAEGGAVLLQGERGGPLAAALRTLWNTLELGAAVDGYWASARAFELAALLLAGWEAGRQERPSPLVEAAAALMRSEFAYLEGMDDLADRLGVSKCHLIRRFSAEMGITPGRFLTQRRMEYAKLLLQSGQYRLETIADMVGVSGANYLCKVFRRETGLTPETYAASAPRAPRAGDGEPVDPRFYL